eukprot:2938212-Rhodomonas_salina.1
MEAVHTCRISFLRLPLHIHQSKLATQCATSVPGLANRTCCGRSDRPPGSRKTCPRCPQTRHLLLLSPRRETSLLDALHAELQNWLIENPALRKEDERRKGQMKRRMGGVPPAMAQHTRAPTRARGKREGQSCSFFLASACRHAQHRAE